MGNDGQSLPELALFRHVRIVRAETAQKFVDAGLPIIGDRLYAHAGALPWPLAESVPVPERQSLHAAVPQVSSGMFSHTGQ